ncbi:unnamed protein product [Parnassius mnemosyne]|uniref:Reverse transcriptase domain-containing protein n=2 Tax=Parnassius mnemosyne TaxID=213953 RepID=A0AAV1LQ51_9NEOP
MKKEFDRGMTSDNSNSNGARGRSRRGRALGLSADGGKQRRGAGPAGPAAARGMRMPARASASAGTRAAAGAAHWLSGPATGDVSEDDQNASDDGEEPMHENLFDGTLGKYTGEEVKLHVREGTQPIYCRARPVPYALLPRVDAELDAMLRAGVVEPVDRSDWATPLVIARKADGGIRLCVDYKVTLNKALMVDRYPVPKVEDLFSGYFTKLDLSQAYNQLHFK